jgi:hypothetical protein
MVLLAKMVSLAAPDIQAKMESPELLDTPVNSTTGSFFKHEQYKNFHN